MNFNFNNNYINILIKIYIYDVLIATSIKAENIFLSKTYSSTVAMTNKFMARVRDMPYVMPYVIYFANTSFLDLSWQYENLVDLIYVALKIISKFVVYLHL